MTAIGNGHPHARGHGRRAHRQPLLPGNFNTNGGNAGFAAGLDRSGDRWSISTGLRFKSLEVSSGWSTGIAAGGQPHPGNIINYAGSKTPILLRPTRWIRFNRVFTGVGGDAAPSEDQLGQARSWTA